VVNMINKNIDELRVLVCKRIKKEEYQDVAIESLVYAGIKKEGCIEKGIMYYDSRAKEIQEDRIIIEAVTYKFISDVGTYFITSMDLEKVGQCYRVCKREPVNDEYEVLQDDEKYIPSLGYGLMTDEKYFTHSMGFYKVKS
jgi:hypothetical protein